jgi:hypothetical protein
VGGCRFGVVSLPNCGRPTLLFSPFFLFADVLCCRCVAGSCCSDTDLPSRCDRPLLLLLDLLFVRVLHIFFCLLFADVLRCRCVAGGCYFDVDLPSRCGRPFLLLLDLFFARILQIFPCLFRGSVMCCMTPSSVERLGLDLLFLFLRCVDLLRPCLWGAGLASGCYVALDLLH